MTLSEQDLAVTLRRPASASRGMYVGIDSAVRITHIPTGLWAESESARSQLENRALALRELEQKVEDLGTHT